MQTYFLSVIRPIQASGGAAFLVTLLRVETDAPLTWMRTHADEIAERSDGPGYVALMVHEKCHAEMAA